MARTSTTQRDTRSAKSEKVSSKSRQREEDDDVLDDQDDTGTDAADDSDNDGDEDEQEQRDTRSAKGRNGGGSSKSASASSSKGRSKASSRDDDDGDDDTINWADVEEQEGGDLEVLPRGKYACTIDESEFALSKENQNPMINLRMEVTDGEYEGRKLWYRIVLTKKTVGMVKHSLRVLGVKFPTKEMSWKAAGKWLEKLADSGDLIGQELTATVKIRTYEGEKRNEVRSIADSGEGTAEGDDDFME